jgi:hypothetical protein
LVTLEPLIYTAERIAQAHGQRAERRTLVEKWVTFPGGHWELARAQIEAAARLVPPDQRARLLRPLHSKSDKHATVAVGVLLLAKVLSDQGWQVEHEPEVAGLTPDLRIVKGGANFLVEARSVVGPFGLPSAYQRLEAELARTRTRTPAVFHTMQVDGRASLKRFKAFLLGALEEKRQGRIVYQEEDPPVLICFELLPPLDEEVGVFTGHQGEATWFDDRPAVQVALDDKLDKYRFPLIVALQGIDTGNLFDAAEETLFGTEVVKIPIGHATGGPVGPASLARQPDAIGLRPNSDGERVRNQLEALLPFEVLVGDEGFKVRARLLANPLKTDVVGLEEFRPIPSLLPIGPGRLAYVGREGKPLGDDEPIIDGFIP